MNTAACAFAIQGPIGAATGFLLARFLYTHPKGMLMHAHIKSGAKAAADKVGYSLDWIAEGRRIPVAIVTAIFLVLAGYGYTFQASRVSANDVSDLVDCITHYSHYTSSAQKERAMASVELQRASGDLVASPSPVTRDAYLSKLDIYLDTAAGKPFRLFDRKFCVDYGNR